MSAVSAGFGCIRNFGRNVEAQVLVIGALLTPLFVLMAALAVDTGAIAEQKREIQGLADLSAIAAAANIDNAERAVFRVLSDNAFLPEDSEDLNGHENERRKLRAFENQVSVEIGRYRPDPDTAFDVRFEVGGKPANAVRVTLKQDAHNYFATKRTTPTSVEARGTAMTSSQVALSIGSRLASLEDGLLNLLLSELTGSDVELRLMDYRALANANVDLFSFSEVLASNLNLTAVTYDDVLDQDVTLAQVFSAMSEASTGNVRSRTALLALANDPAMSDLTIHLGALFDLGQAGRLQLGEPPSGLALQLEAVEMLTASAFAANGDHQIELDLGGDVPGLASTMISLRVGERPQSMPWFSLTDNGQDYVSTAQLRLLIEAELLPSSGLLGNTLVRLPIFIELASAKARVRDVICDETRHGVKRVDVDVHPAISEIRIADLPDGLSSLAQAQQFEAATLVDARLLRVSGFSQTSLSSPDAKTLRFHKSQVGGDPKTVETTEALEGAISSAIGSVQLKGETLGLSLTSPDALTKAVAATLSGAAGPIDSLVHQLSNLLGIGLGEADIWVHDAQCNRAVLVQ
ncbi:MAG: TadG family pilus assembly protein [Henriciella sp.]